jgi:hypothetical protein
MHLIEQQKVEEKGGRCCQKASLEDQFYQDDPVKHV